ncbi:hypothetical protein [Serratia microhaemolytica]|uniref:hypothetical protein n=1 Tax=Serratia microhaemolytica TaxID=2675110 RepID=UPI000FDDB31B|nr:hypothetical protein [Serratia microhaemolytica]
MLSSRLSKLLIFFAILLAIVSFLRSDFIVHYLERSAIHDKFSVLIKVWNDNGLTIDTVKFDDSEATIAEREKQAQLQRATGERKRWYLKGHRKLTETELDCLSNHLFSTVILEGYLDIICDYDGKIIYIY